MATEDAADVDPEQLQAQLDRIQEAMGITERYRSAIEQWLVFGVLVAAASVVSQFVYANELPWLWYWVVWIGGLGGGSALYARLRGESVSWGGDEGRPDVNAIVGAVYFAFLPILWIVGYYAPDLTYAENSLLALSVVSVLLGVAYLVVGNVLKAYYIRAGDRYAFYAGGVLLAALGPALPAFEPTRTYPYLVFGGVYLAYSVVAYAYLR